MLVELPFIVAERVIAIHQTAADSIMSSILPQQMTRAVDAASCNLHHKMVGFHTAFVDAL